MTFDDDMLRAYLAGDLPADQAAALEAQIETDPDLEARLHALDLAAAAPLQQAFAGLPDAGHLDRLAQDLRGEAATPPAARAGAAGLIGLAAALLLAFGLGAWVRAPGTSDVPSRWQDQVAIYQALYVTETVGALQFAPDEVAGQLSAASAALGRDIPLDVVDDIDGMVLRRAQILGFDSAPLIQMAYLSADGAPIALCAVRLEGAEDQAPVLETLAGLPATHWISDGYGFMLVGDIPQSRLQSLARSLQGTL